MKRIQISLPLSKPIKATVIYDTIHAVEAQKGSRSLWPFENFRHDFKSKSRAIMLGLSDGSILIKSVKGKRLWKKFKY